MDRIETLLYKLFIATERDRSDSSNGVCLSTDQLMKAKAKDCDNENDINCTSVDLLNNQATCFKCVSDNDNLVGSCKHYIPLVSATLNMQSDAIIIIIEFDETGSVSIISSNVVQEANNDERFDFPAVGCNCTWSNYVYSSINKTQQLQANEDYHRLFCECDEDTADKQNLYCIVENLKAACYEKTVDCTSEEGETHMSCTINKYDEKENTAKPITINVLKFNEEICPRLGEISKCNFVFTLSNKLLDTIIIKNENLHWTEDLKRNVTITCGDNCDGIKFDDLCTKEYDVSACRFVTTDSTESPTTPSNPTDSPSSISGSTILIIIIVILLVLFIAYCGYQHQWHVKVSVVLQ